jgi:hypothetical protein
MEATETLVACSLLHFAAMAEQFPVWAYGNAEISIFNMARCSLV